jgi:hypothetical protein
MSKTVYPTSVDAWPHRRVTGKKAVIRDFPQEYLLWNFQLIGKTAGLGRT